MLRHVECRYLVYLKSLSFNLEIENSLRLYFDFMYMNYECLPEYMLYTSCPGKSGEGIRSTGTGVIDDYEASCRCWGLSSGPLDQCS